MSKLVFDSVVTQAHVLVSSVTLNMLHKLPSFLTGKSRVRPQSVVGFNKIIIIFIINHRFLVPYSKRYATINLFSVHTKQ